MKMLKFSWIILLSLSFVACNQPRDIDSKKEISSIESVLNFQTNAWNDGNIEKYMSGYWQNDSLVFTGGKNMTQGWHQSLERYKKSYPDKAAMGELTFTDLETSLTTDITAFSTGSWHVKTDSNLFEGRFTLIWKKINDKWFIIADHSS